MDLVLRAEDAGRFVRLPLEAFTVAIGFLALVASPLSEEPVVITSDLESPNCEIVIGPVEGNLTSSAYFRSGTIACGAQKPTSRAPIAVGTASSQTRRFKNQKPSKTVAQEE